MKRHKQKRVTGATACVACRRRKSKCDSTRPACSACSLVYKTECHYGEGSQIRSAQQSSSSLPEIAPSISGLSQSIEILSSRADISPSLIRDMASLRTRLLSLDPNDLRRKSTTPEEYPESSSTSTCAVDYETESKNSKGYRWFKDRAHGEFAEELIGIWLGHHHRYLPVLDADAFLDDFRSENERYCSSVLVYAIMTAACDLWQRDLKPETDEYQHIQRWKNDFVDITHMTLTVCEASLPAIQASVIFSIHRLSTEKPVEAFLTLGLAVRRIITLGLNSTDEPSAPSISPVERSIRRSTFWSVFVLEIFVARLTGRASQISNDVIGTFKPGSQSYHKYFHDGKSQDPPCLEPTQYSYVDHLCDLSQLVNGMSTFLRRTSHHITVPDIDSDLRRYSAWESNFLADHQSVGATAPQYIFLHMYYRQSILLLLRNPNLMLTWQTDTPILQLYLQRALQILRLWQDFKGRYCMLKAPVFMVSPLQVAALALSRYQHEASARRGLAEITEDLRKLSDIHRLAEEALLDITAQTPTNFQNGTA